MAYPNLTSKYLVSAQAATPVRALRWEMHDALHLLQTLPQVTWNTVVVLTQTLMEFIEFISALSCGCAEERLLWLVQHLADDLRENDHVVLPITQQELAASTGLSLYTVNRILRRWERQRIIKKHRHRIIVQGSKLRLYIMKKSKL